MRRTASTGPAALHGCASLFGALANEERLRILDQLLEGERRVSDLAGAAGVDISTLSQRLAVLRRQGLVCQRRDGRNIYYSIAGNYVASLIKHARAHVREAQRAGR